ncbi:MAG: erythromycin esterase family protein [Candidatus Aminicenantes bacterium]|nr:erythromycin esterase family protein [Candidatus Aminicenantes bacterium]
MPRFRGLAVSLAALSLFSLVEKDLGGSAQAAAAKEGRIAYLKKHAVPVRSIDAEDGNFADLEPLREAIGSRRIVMLGEATHGDGATFAAKVRLIKFLHERMGFDVLAFESGFYDLRRAWSALQAGQDPRQAVSSGLFEEWSASRQTQPLWSYLAEQSKTSHPLALAGFDMQFTGSASRDHLLDDLSNYLAGAGLPPGAAEAAEAAARVKKALALVLENPNFIGNGSEFKNIKPEDQAAVLIAHQALGRALGLLPPTDEPGMLERDFWMQFLKSSAAYLEQSWRVQPESLDDAVLDWAIDLRDRQMADNFIWLAKRAYPTRKIIVWAATSHIIRYRQFSVNKNDPKNLMGDWIDKAMGPEVYVLGFTAYRGRWGTVQMPTSREVGPAAPDSLEELFFSAGFEYAWLDFRNSGADGAWLREPLSSRPLGYKPMLTDWTRIMDGMFFIKEMVPSPRIEINFFR